MAKFRYQAFISYSHADHDWGVWLHKQLEDFKVPKGLPVSAKGRVHGRFGRVYRDEAEEGAAAELGPRIDMALQTSRALVVIASPRSARSEWVNKEITQFKQLGREDRVFVLIVDGSPYADDPEQECFAQALKFKLDDDGNLSDEVADPLAVDVNKFGRADATLRLMSGLLGVNYDDLKQRDQLRLKRERRRARALFATGLVLTLLASVGLWLSLKLTRDVETRSSLLFAEQAKDLNEAGQPDRAMMWAVGGLPHPEQLIKGSYHQARAQFIRSYREDLIFGFPGLRTWGEKVSADGSLILTESRPMADNEISRIDIWNYHNGELLGSLDVDHLRNASARFLADTNDVMVKSSQAILIWNWPSDSLSQRWSIENSYIYWEKLSPQETHILAFDSAGRAYLVELESGDSRIIFTGEGDYRTHPKNGRFNDDATHVSLTVSNEARFFNLETGEEVSESEFESGMSPPEATDTVTLNKEGQGQIEFAEAHLDPVPLMQGERRYRDARHSPAKQFIFAVSRDNEGVLHDPKTGAVVRELGILNNSYGVRISRDDAMLAENREDGSVRILDLKSGEVINTLKGEQLRVVDFGADNTELLTRSGMRYARWNIATAEMLESVDFGESNLSDIRQLEDGAIDARVRLEHAENQDYLKRRDTHNGRLLKVHRWHQDSVHVLALHPDGQQLVSVSKDGVVRISKTSDGSLIKLLNANFDKPGFLDFFFPSVTFSPDGERALFHPVNDGKAILWDTRSWLPVAELSHPEEEILIPVFSADSQWLVTSTEREGIRIWDGNNGQLLHQAHDEDEPFWALSFMPTGEALLVSEDGVAQTIDPRDGSRQKIFEGLEIASFVQDFSPDGRYFVGSINDASHIYDAASGQKLADIPIETAYPVKMRFSGDGTAVVGAREDGLVLILSVPDGRILSSFRAHDDSWSGQGLYSHGNRILTVSEKTLKLWDLKSGALLRDFSTDESLEFSRATFSPAGDSIYAATSEGLILQFDALKKPASWTLMQMFERGCEIIKPSPVNHYLIASPVLSGRAADGGVMTDPCDKRGILNKFW